MSLGRAIPFPLTNFPVTAWALEAKAPIVFLDYDGTVALIADAPAQVALSEDIRDALRPTEWPCCED